MFHRVKSELSPAEQKNQEKTQDNAWSETEDVSEDESNAGTKSASNAPNMAAKAEPKTSYFKSSQFQSTTTPAKDKQSMINENFASDKRSMETSSKSKSSEAFSPEIPTGPYVRPGQSAASRMSTPSRAGAGYPGASSYSATNSTSSQASYATSPYSAPKENERTLTIGAGITMSGEIESCDYLLVEGTVEAALKGARLLEIAESGTFYGTVEIEEAVISGRFEGDIMVNGRLIVKSTGYITGSIAYQNLEVESGAVLDGKLTPVKNFDASSESVVQPSVSRVSSSKKESTSAKGSSSSNNESGLFSKAPAIAE